MHIKKNEIEAYIDSKRQEILNKWEYLVNLEGNNIEKEDMDIIANWLYREFTEAGVCCELRVAHEKSGKVLVGTAGADRPEKPIVFSGHYDTVFQKGQLGNHPFHIQDGVAYGPGVLDMKGGIAYFSHEGEAYVNGQITTLEIGNTRVVAEKMQARIDADIFRIETVEPYPYDHMETVEQAKQEQKTGARPKLKALAVDMDSYDTILLGYPNWWNTMPMAVFTFLEAYDFSDKVIAPFCTHEGSGMGSSEKDIKKLCARSELQKGLTLVGGRVSSADKDIERWLKELNLLEGQGKSQ